MAAFKHPDNIRSGDDYLLKIKFKTAVDITGYKFYFTLKTSFESTDAEAILQQSHIAGAGENDDAVNGVCWLSVPASITTNLATGSYFYDLQVITPTGEIATIAPPKNDYRHKLVVIPSVTRALT